MATNKEVIDKIKRDIEAGLKDNKELDFILKEVPEQIEKRTRLGKGTVDGGANEKLKPLSPSYIMAREGFKVGEVHFNAKTKKSVKKVKFKAKGLPKLSELTTPRKSNLTLTGQLLKSIEGIRKGTLFTFSLKGKRDDGLTNEQVGKYVKEGGRSFFSLSKSEKQGLSRKIAKVIKESVKKAFDK